MPGRTTTGWAGSFAAADEVVLGRRTKQREHGRVRRGAPSREALNLVTTNAAANGSRRAIRTTRSALRTRLGRLLDEESACPASLQGEHGQDADMHRLGLGRLLQRIRHSLRPGHPSVAASFGNEWDFRPRPWPRCPPGKRSLEALRSAEALATLVALRDPRSSTAGTRPGTRPSWISGSTSSTTSRTEGPRLRPDPDRLAAPGRGRDRGLREHARRRLVAGARSADPEDRQVTPVFVFNSLSGRGRMSPTFRTLVRCRARARSHDRQDVPSQIVTISGSQYLRVQAPNVPSVGYKVSRSSRAQARPSPAARRRTRASGVMENEYYPSRCRRAVQ